MEAPVNSITRELKDLMHQLLRAHASSDRETCSCYGVTPLQALVLVEISKKQPLGMQQLAQRMHLTVSTMSRVVEKLVDCGLVSRQEDANDRRAVLCTLSEAGEKTAQQLDACYVDFFEGIIANMSEEDLPGFLKGLRVVVKQMKGSISSTPCSGDKDE
jgi:DNA-binding MarR family transcriptional regulator